jgi:2-hydroxy-4-carboxymuconate semialdehyde hemiacetal dehydrogenase
MKICVAGQGAFGQKHLDAIKRIDGVDVTSLIGGNPKGTEAIAAKYGIAHWGHDLAEGIARTDAVILATPTQMHRVIAMAGHVRRFNPSHQWVKQRLHKGELAIQQMDVQTYFFRRTNMNAAGKPRSWTDHLLWHHACHTVDLFHFQTGETASECYAVQGPRHPELGIAMDMGIVMKVPSGAMCTLSLSFNNNGPIGSFFRYICDNGTYRAYYDDLVDGKDNPIDLSKVDVSMDGIELEDREFIAAIKENREPNSSLEQILPCMQVLDRLEKIIDPDRNCVV